MTFVRKGGEYSNQVVRPCSGANAGGERAPRNTLKNMAFGGERGGEQNPMVVRTFAPLPFLGGEHPNRANKKPNVRASAVLAHHLKRRP